MAPSSEYHKRSQSRSELHAMDVERLKLDNDTLRSEVCRCKLDSKCEALLILSKDLDQSRQERDQFKLMAEQVQARYQSIKRQLAGVGPRSASLEGVEYSDMKRQSLAHLLCEMRDINKSLQFETDDLKQKLKDANGDIKLLREQIARHRVGTTDEGMDTRHFPAHEREDLVKLLETDRDKMSQMERDLQQLLDEKEELVMERDVYRNKYERLNKELNLILKGDERRILDIDALVTENRYLQERIRQAEDERVMAMSTVSKYKSILEKKKTKGILKLGQNRSGGLVISQKQVHQLLENGSCLSPTPQMMLDLQSLASALLETLNDKNVALSHQRKTNKILGTRVAELESKLKSFELAEPWTNSEQASNCLAKLKLEYAEIKTLLPSKESEVIGDLLDPPDDGHQVQETEISTSLLLAGADGATNGRHFDSAVSSPRSVVQSPPDSSPNQIFDQLRLHNLLDDAARQITRSDDVINNKIGDVTSQEDGRCEVEVADLLGTSFQSEDETDVKSSKMRNLPDSDTSVKNCKHSCSPNVELIS